MGHLCFIDHVGCNGFFLQQLSFYIPAAITICASLLAVVFLNTRFHLLVRLLWVGFTWIAVTIGILLVSKNSSAAILYTGFAGGAFLVFSVKKERAYIIFFVLISIMAWITRWGLEDDLLGIMVVSDPLALRYVDLLAVLSVFIILIIQYSAVGTISKSYSRYLYEANKKASAANLAKTRFLANMSHEIRTPMNGIMGVLELFEAKQLDHEQARLIKVMRDSSAVLLRLVDEILDSSKVEAGRVELNLEPTALLELFENIVEGILPFAQSRNVEFSLNFDPQLPQRIDVDPGRLRQIILNLLTNAIKFSTPSLAGKTGAVSLCLTRDEKDHLLIVVSDNGIGIDVKNHQDIFKPFLQVESGAGLDFGGTGLGLSVVYQLVSKMNGTIKVDSMKGSGATFEITLPMVNPEGSVNIPCLESEQVLCLHQPGKPPRAFERYVRATGANWHSFDQPSALLGFLKTTASPPFIVIANSGLGDLQKDQLFRDIAMHDPDLPVVTFASRAHPDFKKILSGRRVLARRPMLPSEVWRAFSEMHAAQLSRTQSGLQKIKPITPTLGPVQTQILLIDQNEVSRLILKHQLEKLGCVVAEAAHFQEALLVLRDKAFDLILIDAVLIEASSQSVIVEIRALQSKRHETQMALIAVGRIASPVATVLQGVDAQLQKPVSTLELAQMVDRWRGPIDPNVQKYGLFRGVNFVCAIVFAHRPTYHIPETFQLDKVICLAAKFIGNHRRLAANRRHNGHAYPLALQAFNQGPKISIPREQNDVIDMRCQFHCIHSQFDIHIALDLATALTVGEFFGGFCDHGKTVIIQPVDQRANW